MKESKQQAYINTIMKVHPTYSREFLEELSNNRLSTLYKQCNILPSIVRTHPKDVKTFRKKLFKNKDILFKDIGSLTRIREQDNNSFELIVDIECSRFESEVRSSVGYDSTKYARSVLNTLFSDDFKYRLNAELDVNKHGTWFWNKWGEKETECFMYLVISITNLDFTTKEKAIFTGEVFAPYMSDYYSDFHYALWVELSNGRCGYVSTHIVGTERSSIRFATRLDDVRRLRVLKEPPSYKDFFNTYHSNFGYIEKAELVMFKYKHISETLKVV